MRMPSKKLVIGEGLSDRFLMGSRYFFGDIEGYEGKDYDYLIFVDKPLIFRDVLNMRGHGENKMDIFYWRKKTPEEFVQYLKNDSDTPMQAGKFLVKEICEYIGFTMEHLKQLSDVFDRMDERHSYEKVIYEAYLKNGDFTLTDEQRQSAYEKYLENKSF